MFENLFEIPVPGLVAGALVVLVLVVMMLYRLSYASLVVMAMFFIASTAAEGTEFGGSRLWLYPIQAARSDLFLVLGALLVVPVFANPGRIWQSISLQGSLVVLMGLYSGLLRMGHETPISGVQTLIFAALTAGTLLLVVPALIDDWSDFNGLIRGMGFVNLIWIGAVAIQIAVNAKLLTVGKDARFLGLTGNPQHAATFLSVLAAVALWLILNDNRLKLRPLWIILLGIDLILLLWTGSRTGAGMFVIGAMMVTYARLGKAVLYFPLLFLGLLLAYQTVIWLGVDLANAERLTSTEDTRTAAWLSLLEDGMEAPLFGVGIAGGDDTENSYLFAFRAFGIGMVVLLLLLVVVSAVLSLKLFALRWQLGRQQKPIVDIILSLNAMYFAGGVFEGYMVARVGSPLVMIMIAAAMATRLLHMARDEIEWAEANDEIPFAGEAWDDYADEDEEEDEEAELALG